jgi:N-methylhydantoinase A/oxoprolinase/acetone carboxylase beta subunit
VETAVWRGELEPGTALEGPAVCELPEATLVVAPGWRGQVDATGAVKLERSA